MSLNRSEKAAVTSDVAAQVAKSQTLALAEYRGLTVEQLNKLRVDARSNTAFCNAVTVTPCTRSPVSFPHGIGRRRRAL